jgi:hypothetical protein
MKVTLTLLIFSMIAGFSFSQGTCKFKFTYSGENNTELLREEATVSITNVNFDNLLINSAVIFHYTEELAGADIQINLTLNDEGEMHTYHIGEYRLPITGTPCDENFEVPIVYDGTVIEEKDSLVIEGFVRDLSNKRLKGVDVAFDATGIKILKCITGSNGKYQFKVPANYQDSTFNLSFSKDEYFDLVVNGKVTSDPIQQLEQITLALRPEEKKYQFKVTDEKGIIKDYRISDLDQTKFKAIRNSDHSFTIHVQNVDEKTPIEFKIEKGTFEPRLMTYDLNSLNEVNTYEIQLQKKKKKREAAKHDISIFGRVPIIYQDYYSIEMGIYKNLNLDFPILIDVGAIIEYYSYTDSVFTINSFQNTPILTEVNSIGGVSIGPAVRLLHKSANYSQFRPFLEGSARVGLSNNSVSGSLLGVSSSLVAGIGLSIIFFKHHGIGAVYQFGTFNYKSDQYEFNPIGDAEKATITQKENIQSIKLFYAYNF